MAIEVKHATLTTKPDDPNYDVSANEWNENHTVTGALDSTGDTMSGPLTLDSGPSSLVIPELTAGSIPFIGSGNELAEAAADLAWNDTSKTLIVGEQGFEAGGINVNGVVYDAALKVSDISSSNPAMLSLHRHSTTWPSILVASRANSDTSSHSAVTNGMALFQNYTVGYTGSNYDIFTLIECGADTGTISTTSSPGYISFQTTPDGSQSPVERLKIGEDGVAAFSGDVKITDEDIILGTTTGTKIGTATGQKLGLWNAAPVIQQTTAGAAATFVANTSGIADDTATFDGYTIGQVVRALRTIGALA